MAYDRTTEWLLGRELGEMGKEKTEDLSTKTWWMWLHFLSFFIGGFAFVAGTAVLQTVGRSSGGSGWLYTIGSFGFFTVDIMEILTFTEDAMLRQNMLMSCVGNFLYFIGSIGYIPVVYTATQGTLGIWGFIIGSAVIGASQLWKIHRIGSNRGSFQLKKLIATADNFTAVGVELNACIGALCFFVGTSMYLHGPLEGPFYALILAIWMAGSCCFAAGSLFLGYRHAVLRI